MLITDSKKDLLEMKAGWNAFLNNIKILYYWRKATRLVSYYLWFFLYP